MKAIRTVGIMKATRFVLWELFGGLLSVCVVPQIRVMMLRLAGASIGNDTVVQNIRFTNLYHYGFSRVAIGSRCFIGDEVMVDTRGGVKLEDDVTISNRTTIVSHINVGYPDHPLQRIYPTKERSVTIKRGAFIATGVLILPGVTIGRECVVGAGSVVVKNVADKTLVAGIPARVIKTIRS